MRCNAPLRRSCRSRIEEFDAALAQLVVHFMADPVAGLREMARVTREGGVVAACVWDHAGGKGPLSLFWRRRDSPRRSRTEANHEPLTLHSTDLTQGLTGVPETFTVVVVGNVSDEMR